MILFAADYLARCSPNFLSRFPTGLAAPLRWGDANFYDHTGVVGICVEVKKALDMAVCIEQTGRLAKQIREARDDGGFGVYCLIVQDCYRTEDGMLGTWRTSPYSRRRELLPVLTPGHAGHPVPYARFDNFLTTVAYLGGILVKRASGEAETAAMISDLYAWWQKDIEDHTSLDRFYTPMALPVGRQTLVRRVAKELPGVGQDRSRAVAEHFPTVRDMAQASVKEWKKIPGIGLTTARKVVQALQEPEQWDQPDPEPEPVIPETEEETDADVPSAAPVLG